MSAQDITLMILLCIMIFSFLQIRIAKYRLKTNKRPKQSQILYNIAIWTLAIAVTIKACLEIAWGVADKFPMLWIGDMIIMNVCVGKLNEEFIFKDWTQKK